jgi:hypothetical protein
MDSSGSLNMLLSSSQPNRVSPLSSAIDDVCGSTWVAVFLLTCPLFKIAFSHCTIRQSYCSIDLSLYGIFVYCFGLRLSRELVWELRKPKFWKIYCSAPPKWSICIWLKNVGVTIIVYNSIGTEPSSDQNKKDDDGE